MDVDALVRERYGLVDAEVEPHEGGMNSSTWWVRTDGATYVAKWVSDATVGSLGASVEAAALAERSGVATGAALPSIGGDRVVLVEDGSLVLMERLTGTEVDDDADLGRILARVHATTAGHDLALGLRWPWVDPTNLADWPDLVAAVTAALDDMVALGPLVTGVAHGDPAPEAFLRLDDGRSALIDWAGALTAPLLYDVASTAMYLGGIEAAAPMLAAYAGADGPATPDLPHAATMLRFRWAVQADYFARRLVAGDRTGTDDAGNAQGLADARAHLLHSGSGGPTTSRP